ncbi:DUF4232 domain-containing protein [Streptomycetaceae bacterium NBC_01309]
MSARTARTRLFAATTVALAAFALTACSSNDDDGARAGASSPAPTAAAQAGSSGTGGATAAPTQTAAGTPGADTAGSGTGTGSTATQGSKTSGGTGSSGGSGGTNTSGGSNGGTTSGGNTSGGSGTNANIPQCGGSNTKTTATVVARPLNHLLLTVTNTGSKACDLIGYPAARFGEAQAVPPVDETTKPQSVIRLAPGESGYAGVRLSAADGSGTNGYTTSTLEIWFEDGSVAKPSLPAAGVYVDTALQVTYWQQTLDQAIN